MENNSYFCSKVRKFFFVQCYVPYPTCSKWRRVEGKTNRSIVTAKKQDTQKVNQLLAKARHSVQRQMAAPNAVTRHGVHQSIESSSSYMHVTITRRAIAKRQKAAAAASSLPCSSGAVPRVSLITCVFGIVLRWSADIEGLVTCACRNSFFPCSFKRLALDSAALAPKTGQCGVRPQRGNILKLPDFQNYKLFNFKCVFRPYLQNRCWSTNHWPTTLKPFLISSSLLKSCLENFGFFQRFCFCIRLLNGSLRIRCEWAPISKVSEKFNFYLLLSDYCHAWDN